MQDYFELVSHRQSCRKYDPARAVEREKLEKCVNAARLAPSACNSQPWFFRIVSTPALAKQVAECLQDGGMNRFTSDCPAFAVITELPAKLAPTVAGKFASQKFAANDIGMAAAHYCLAADAQGLSTCVIGWINSKKLRALLDIPESEKIPIVIATGYAHESDTLRTKKRRELDEMSIFIEE